MMKMVKRRHKEEFQVTKPRNQKAGYNWKLPNCKRSLPGCNWQLPWHTAPDSDGSDSSSRDRWSSAKQWYTSASRAERERMWHLEHFDQTLGANHSPDSPSHIYKIFHLCQDFITFPKCSPSWRSDPSEICTTAWPRTDPPFNQIHQKSARNADE